IAFDPADGLIYHASGYPNTAAHVFETVDPGSFVVTNIPLSGFEYPEIAALAPSSAGGGFIASDIFGNYFTMSTTGFASSPLGAFDFGTAKGLAFDSDLCERPSTCATRPVPCLGATKAF